MPVAASGERASVQGSESIPLAEGWQAACTAPGSHEDPATLDGLDWIAADVPGTAAQALRRSGALGAPGERDLDAEDWWFRARFESGPAGAGERVLLHLGGIATVADVFLNGEPLLHSKSMFAVHRIDVSTMLRSGGNELAIRCQALAPLLAARRRPRARWRTRLVRAANLRFFRTMLLGRAPGFAPGPAAVGPWREVSLERCRRVAVVELRLRPRLDGAAGVLEVTVAIDVLEGEHPSSIEVELDGPSGTHRSRLDLQATEGGVTAGGKLTVPEVARWWPHTHGDPALHRVRLLLDGGDEPLGVDAGRVGFRALAPGPSAGHEILDDGLDLHINDVRVFARGAVWTPIDPVGMAPDADVLRAALEAARDSGMNMIRIPGTAAYESTAFYDLCDELGILVWQDFMFANFDYPIADPELRAAVTSEAEQVLDALAGRAALAVLCGNSEVEQQAAMFGADPALGRGELFGELLPAAVLASGADAIYVPSAPCGGSLPFRPGSGIANYYGVGGYRRPLGDVRRSAVRFAAECLAFANVPDDDALAAIASGAGGVLAHDPRWKAGVPRDVGSGWDFDDVRDHYLELLFGLDPVVLRGVDHDRYLELSRFVSGEVIAEVFGEWRRRGSPCGGGIVLWMRDLLPGAGWGLLDHRGEPKVALHHFRRALEPVAAWSTDEGLGGIALHVANDRSDVLRARLRLSLYRGGETLVGEATEPIELGPHHGLELDAEEMLGRFVDAAYAYRFGPPGQDAIVATLTGGEDAEQPDPQSAAILSQSFRFPAGRPLAPEPAGRLGLAAVAMSAPGGRVELELSSRRLAYGVRIHAPGHLPGDDAFCIEPGGTRTVPLRPREQGAGLSGATLTALNLEGRVRVEAEAVE